MSTTDEPRTHRLAVEAELPDFWVEDMIKLCREFGYSTDGEPLDVTKPTEELLHEVGDLFGGLLTVEVSGEKDSTIARDVPILFRRAWVETEPPSDYGHVSLIDKERERRAEEAAELADAKATVRAFHALIREHFPDRAAEVCGAAIDAGSEAYEKTWAKHFPEVEADV
jgi:hypothetical protein